MPVLLAISSSVISSRFLRFSINLTASSSPMEVATFIKVASSIVDNIVWFLEHPNTALSFHKTLLHLTRPNNHASFELFYFLASFHRNNLHLGVFKSFPKRFPHKETVQEDGKRSTLRMRLVTNCHVKIRHFSKIEFAWYLLAADNYQNVFFEVSDSFQNVA